MPNWSTLKEKGSGRSPLPSGEGVLSRFRYIGPWTALEEFGASQSLLWVRLRSLACWDVNGESTWLPTKPKPLIPSCFTASCGQAGVSGVLTERWVDSRALTWCTLQIRHTPFHPTPSGLSETDDLGNTPRGKGFDLRGPRMQTQAPLCQMWCQHPLPLHRWRKKPEHCDPRASVP